MSAPSKQEMDFLRQQIQKAEQDLGNLTSKAAAIQQGQSLEQQNAANKSSIVSLQIQISSQQNYLTQLTSQYAPLEEQMKQLQLKNSQDAAAIQAAQAEVTGKQSNISFLQSMFAKMVQISNNYAESNGVKINETMVCADIMPPEHLVHTSVFTDAIMSNNKEAFDLALSKVPVEDINHRDSKGKTLLMYAAANGFAYGVEKLLEKGADADAFDMDGIDALGYASTNPHIDTVKCLAIKTHNVNAQYKKFNNDTAIHQLVRNTYNTLYSEEFLTGLNDLVIDGAIHIYGSIGVFNVRHENATINICGMGEKGYTTLEDRIFRMINHLLERGFNPDLPNEQSLTPFVLACAHRFKYLANQLVDNLPLNLNATDLLGRGSLVYAMNFGDVEFLEKLRLKGATPDSVDYEARTSLHWMSTKGFGLNWKDDIADWFLAHGADINAQTIIGQTPLSFAAQYNLPGTVKYLLAHSARHDIPQKHGIYPWHMAALFGSLDALQELRTTVVDIDFPINSVGKETALCVASQEGKNEVVTWLLGQNANVNFATESDGKTPLLSAVARGHLEVVKTLVANGAEVNIPDKNLASPVYYSLGYACVTNLDITKYLIFQGGNVNAPMNDGDTPMHMAAYQANVKAMFLLLKHGAVVDVLNHAKKSPLFVLIEKDNLPLESKTEAIKYLLLKGAKFDVQDSEGHSLASVLDAHFPSAKDFVSHPEQLPNLQEFEQTVIGEV